MARVVGLDIGRFSVKAVVLETSMRAFELIEVVEEPIVRAAPDGDDGEHAPGETQPTGHPAAEASAPEPVASDDEDDAFRGLDPAALAALERLRDRGLFEADAIYTQLRPSDVLLTKVALPFSQPREIAAVLAPQLEGRVPAEVDELSIDFMRGGRLPSGEYAVYAAGVDPARLAIVLAELAGVGVDPRVLDVPPFPLMTAARTLVTEPITGPIAVVDIGAETTGVIIFDGADLQYARTFPGGGERATAALAAVFGLDADTAREGKHREGFLDASLPESEGPTGQDATDVSNACREASKGLVRQLRRTLHAHATEWGVGVSRVYLCGGGSMLPGLVDYVGQSLGVDTRPLPYDAPAVALGGFAEVGPRFASALGLALRGTTAPKGSEMNARVGDFSFRGSYEYVRQRAPQIALGLVAIAALGLAFAFGRIASLKAESSALDTALAEATLSVFGESVTEPNAIQSRFRLGAVRPSFLPERSAYAVFVSILSTVGDTVDLGYEVTASDVEVDMERRIFRVEGAADSAESVDTFEAELGALDCLRDIERNDLSQRRGTEGFTFALQGEVRCGGATEEESE